MFLCIRKIFYCIGANCFYLLQCTLVEDFLLRKMKYWLSAIARGNSTLATNFINPVRTFSSEYINVLSVVEAEPTVRVPNCNCVWEPPTTCFVVAVEVGDTDALLSCQSSLTAFKYCFKLCDSVNRTTRWNQFKVINYSLFR